jgi:ATP adenylyltransferase/5',5'''-P-1,P-4-tetraphosphate phosphorylase II
MLVVPRARDAVELRDAGGASVSVAVNALGLCGLLLARAHVRDAIVRAGPVEVLRGVCAR